MEKTEILEKASKNPEHVGEMEKSKINRSCWISNICACVLAVIIMLAEGLLGHFSTVYAVGMICSLWASVLYFCQFFIAKRPWQVLIGGVLHGIAVCVLLFFYIKTNMG